MRPDEIFQLIIKADERLKYATDARSGARREQAKQMLQQALDAAREIGNNALIEQAQRRLADLDASDRTALHLLRQGRGVRGRPARRTLRLEE